jgi:hypothetical protein
MGLPIPLTIVCRPVVRLSRSESISNAPTNDAPVAPSLISSMTSPAGSPPRICGLIPKGVRAILDGAAAG